MREFNFTYSGAYGVYTISNRSSFLSLFLVFLFVFKLDDFFFLFFSFFFFLKTGSKRREEKVQERREDRSSSYVPFPSSLSFIFYFYFYFFSLEIFEKSLTNYTACRPHRQGRAWFTLIRNKRSVVCVETREGEVSGSAWSDNGGRQG